MELPKVYEPGRYEADIYALWEKANAFAPRGAGEPFSVVVPPPNANGNIHVGTAFTLALEDIAVRYHRLKGDRALLLPGADHAGFETQVVYERQLAKEGKSRFDFSREELYGHIWDFVAQNRQNFETQFRRVGASADWSRYTFTLDDKIVKRAYATFKKMWDEGLVYRGERLVNYCTFHRTGFADIEVVHEDAVTPLYYIKYGPFTLATTRPETKFGDTAVAVHPDDKRYQEYVGKVITVEGVNGPFDVQVIADEMVDPEFGTGVVKITPAHSFDDWEVAQRHNLPSKRVINHDGTMNHAAGRFEGMTVMEARKAVVEALQEKGLLIKVDEQYRNRIGKCYKCGTVIEPMLMEQWFINMQPLAKQAITALRAGKITFYPASKQDQLIGYLEGLRDWNISRQIAWGIPVPAFQNVDDTDDWIYDEHVTEEILEIDGKTYRRDPDVFDTWFSSSSWPYATLDYPKGADFKDFYPLSVMETGGEILYPWVSRMLMLGLYVTGEVPFKAVYIHGYVMAEDGAKMSKSLGNVINPLEIIDKYGSDALRMGVIASRAPGVNRGYDPRKVEDARNFCNKLWNIARYIEGAGKVDNKEAMHPHAETIADHWLLTRLRATSEGVAADLERYRFAEAFDTLYHFVWDDFADWYVEAAKAAPNLGLLNFALDAVLTIAHPFAPFVTETIWQTRGKTGDDAVLITARWPEIHETDAGESGSFETVRGIVAEIRGVLKNVGLATTELLYNEAPLIAENAELISRLAHLTGVRQTADPAGLKLTKTTLNCWLAIDDNAIKQYAIRLEEQQLQERIGLERLEKRLANKSYVENAPAAVVAQSRVQLAEAQERLQALETEVQRFRADDAEA